MVNVCMRQQNFGGGRPHFLNLRFDFINFTAGVYDGGFFGVVTHQNSAVLLKSSDRNNGDLQSHEGLLKILLLHQVTDRRTAAWSFLHAH